MEIHYAIGGAGEPVFLLHGVPKTMSYWRHVVPLLTPHYTVIAVDNRGAGGSQRPLTGYDTATMAGDVAELATHLGFDQFRVAGETEARPSPTPSPPSTGPGYSNWCSRKRSYQDCPPANKTPRSPRTTSAPAGTSSSSACRTYFGRGPPTIAGSSAPVAIWGLSDDRGPGLEERGGAWLECAVPVFT